MIMSRWFPEQMQIYMIELLAVMAAIETLHRLEGKLVLILFRLRAGRGYCQG